MNLGGEVLRRDCPREPYHGQQGGEDVLAWSMDSRRLSARAKWRERRSRKLNEGKEIGSRRQASWRDNDSWKDVGWLVCSILK